MATHPIAYLIWEILNDPPIQRCADEGCHCTFCGREWRYFHDTKDGKGTKHRPDCWLVRASIALKRPAPYNGKE